MKVRKLADTVEKRMLWRRIIVFGILFFLLGILQCAFFSRLSPFGATPDIVLGGICAVCMLDNKKTAAVIAVGGGYFVDALGGLPPSFTPLFYLLCVVIIGALSDKMMPGFIAFAVLLAVAAALGGINTYINLWISLRALPAASALTYAVLPGILSTFIFCLPSYLAVKLCVIPIEHR